MSENVKNFFNNHGKDIAVVIFLGIGAYFAIQTNTADIVHLYDKIKDVDTHKVSNSTMVLKEQFLQSELGRIEEEIHDLNVRLDKKIKIISTQETIIHELTVQVAVLETITDQNAGELTGIWKFINKFLEEL